jgi:hypothetical protein
VLGRNPQPRRTTIRAAAIPSSRSWLAEDARAALLISWPVAAFPANLFAQGQSKALDSRAFVAWTVVFSR